MFAPNQAGKELSKKFGLLSINEMADRGNYKQDDIVRTNEQLAKIYDMIKNAGTLSGE